MNIFALETLCKGQEGMNTIPSPYPYYGLSQLDAGGGQRSQHPGSDFSHNTLYIRVLKGFPKQRPVPFPGHLPSQNVIHLLVFQ